MVGADEVLGGPGCAPGEVAEPVDGALVGAFAGAGGGLATVPEFAASGGVVDVVAGGGGVPVLGSAVDGGGDWFGELELPLVSDGDVPTCEGWSLGGPPSSCGLSGGGAASPRSEVAAGIWSGGADWVADPPSAVGDSDGPPVGGCETGGGVSACAGGVSDAPLSPLSGDAGSGPRLES